MSCERCSGKRLIERASNGVSRWLPCPDCSPHRPIQDTGDAERVTDAVLELFGRRSKWELMGERRGELVRVIAHEMNAIIGEWIDADVAKINEQSDRITLLEAELTDLLCQEYCQNCGDPPLHRLRDDEISRDSRGDARCDKCYAPRTATAGTACCVVDL